MPSPFRADPLPLALAAGVLFIAAWAGLHAGWYERDQIVDTPVYEGYGNAIESGKLPYRDFRLEYPPGALPAFAVPSLVTQGRAPERYRSAFEGAMVTSGLAALVFAAFALRAAGAGPWRAGAALAFAALSPLLLGSVVLSRFDLWPAAAVAAALAALAAARPKLGLALLGAAIAIKLYALVIVPVALAYVWRRAGRRVALQAGAIGAGVVGGAYLPFLVLSRDGVAYSLSRQLGRPLQIESLGSSILLGLHHTVGLGVEWASGHGSQNLVGTAPTVVAAVQSVLQLAVLVAIWIAFARGPATPDRLLRYAAGTLVAFVALGKVVSPQFLIWLLVPVALVAGRRGIAGAVLLGTACVLTQLWFPYRYWDLVYEFDGLASTLVLVRNLVLVALLAVLVVPVRASRP